MKVIALLKKRDGMSKEDFIAYYEQHHVPLILSLYPSITTYTRNFADFEGAFVYPDAAPFDFDCVTEICFADRAGYDDMVRRADDPATMDAIRQDEVNFLDQSHTRMFRIDERGGAVGRGR